MSNMTRVNRDTLIDLCLHFNKFIIALSAGLLLISCEKNDPVNRPLSGPVFIPDKELLLDLFRNGVDSDHDSIITYEEASGVHFLDLSNYFGPDITDLTGLEAFINLEILVIRCNKIPEMDLCANTALKEVYAYDNGLTSINVRGCRELTYLHIGSEGLCLRNRISSLDLAQNLKLKTLICNFNHLRELDLSNNVELENLLCQSNELTILDLSNNTSLLKLKAWGNELSELNISGCPVLRELDLALNRMVDVELNSNIALCFLDVSKNPLCALDISGNTSLNTLVVKDLPLLDTICVWTDPFPPPGLNIICERDSGLCFSTECQ